MESASGFLAYFTPHGKRKSRKNVLWPVVQYSLSVYWTAYCVISKEQWVVTGCDTLWVSVENSPARPPLFLPC